MSEKRRGLGRGLGALIPSTPVSEIPESAEGQGSQAKKRTQRPVDVFFPASSRREDADAAILTTTDSETVSGSSAAQVAEVLRAPRRTTPSGTKKPAAKRTAKSEPSTPSPLKGGPLPSTDSHKSNSLENKQADDASEEQELPTGAEVSRETEGPELVEVPGATFAEVLVSAIQPNRKQPRTVFDEEDMAELVHSIREIGVLQPIVVRPADDVEAQYELVMGERRWRATKAAGLETIPAIIRSTADDDLLRDALLENLHRSQLNPLEEAAAYQQLLDDFGCTHDELADRIGRSRPQVSNTLRLMKLPPLVQRRVAAGVLSAGHARALLALTDPAEMEKLAQRIVAEGLSVRATEEIVSLSDGLRRPKREGKPREGARHERLDYLANSLSDRLDTSVKITLGAKKGRVSIEFASVDDLNRIMDVLNPAAP
ncbi:ParB/RepB/Spo0J family partition protein [Arthrobacter sp. NPDC089319]|uniref:ParB/RepB/Spo0J family partition protein n=1 Tax=Arthrobacter sp. NPDC089319 TaxID=3155915 RepID=UPI0034397AE4